MANLIVPFHPSPHSFNIIESLSFLHFQQTTHIDIYMRVINFRQYANENRISVRIMSEEGGYVTQTKIHKPKKGVIGAADLNISFRRKIEYII